MITAVCLLCNVIFLFSCVGRDDPGAPQTPVSGDAHIPDISAAIRQPDKIHDLNVVYKTVSTAQNERDLKIDIYYPTKHVYEKSPLIVGFHGGGWIAGDKSQIMYIFAPVIQELRENGYTVVTAEYRFASGTLHFPAMLEDCIDAVLYLKNNAEKYNIDADSIGVIGYSAGAQLAMLTSYAMAEFSDETVDIKYCLSFAGPAKFYGDEPDKYPKMTLQLLEYLFNGTYSDKENEYMRGSPYYYIDENTQKVPLFLAHDENDHVVPFSQSALMYDKATEAGIPCELLVLNGFYHQIDFSYDYGTTPSSSEAVEIILDFIYKYS